MRKYKNKKVINLSMHALSPVFRPLVARDGKLHNLQALNPDQRICLYNFLNNPTDYPLSRSELKSISRITKNIKPSFLLKIQGVFFRFLSWVLGKDSVPTKWELSQLFHVQCNQIPLPPEDEIPEQPLVPNPPNVPPPPFIGFVNESGADCFAISCVVMVLADPVLTNAILQTRDANLRELSVVLRNARDALQRRRPHPIQGIYDIRICLNRLHVLERLDLLMRAQQQGRIPVVPNEFLGAQQSDATDAFNLITSYMEKYHRARLPALIPCIEDRQTIQNPGTPQEIRRERQVHEASQVLIPNISFPQHRNFQAKMRSYFKETSQAIDDRGNRLLTRTNRKWRQVPERFSVTIQREGFNRIPVEAPLSLRLPAYALDIEGDLPEQLTYKLDSFSIQRGGVMGGHYVTGKRVLMDGQPHYVLIDDHRVIPLTEEQFLRYAQSAIRIFYARDNAPAMIDHAEAGALVLGRAGEDGEENNFDTPEEVTDQCLHFFGKTLRELLAELHTQPQTPGASLAQLMRRTSVNIHPDRGGSTVDFQRLQQLAGRLVRIIRPESIQRKIVDEQERRQALRLLAPPPHN